MIYATVSYLIMILTEVMEMEQHALKKLNNCLNTNIYSGGQSSNLYLNVVHFFNTSVNKTSVAT